MSDKISLTRTQIEFLKYYTEQEDPETAVEVFATLMIEERVDPTLIEKVVEKIMKRMKK